MPVDTNVFVDNLKTVLDQFTLPDEQVKNETARLERLKKQLMESIDEVEDENADKCYGTYRYGLVMLQNRQNHYKGFN